jgi:putative DNA primase/helicase
MPHILNSPPHDPNVKRLIAHVARTSDAPRLRAVIDMATSEPGMTVQLREFDDDPMLLGVDNGVLDLRNGRLLQVSPEVLVSKRCKVVYDPSAECPRFLRYLVEIQHDVEMRDFLQRFAGIA